MKTWDKAIKYHGCRVKPNKYLIKDWVWLVKKVEGGFHNRCYRWLSLGGRLILVKSMLTSILVYWFSLCKIHVATLQCIGNKIMNFMWSSNNDKNKMHISSWESLSLPEILEDGGSKTFFGSILHCA